MKSDEKKTFINYYPAEFRVEFRQTVNGEETKNPPRDGARIRAILHPMLFIDNAANIIVKKKPNK